MVSWIAGRSGLAATMPSGGGIVRVDASHLRQLQKGLNDLHAMMGDKILASSFRDALRSSTVVAKKLTVHRGGFDLARPSLAGRVRQSIKPFMRGIEHAEIKSTNDWPRLFNWAVERDTRGDYTSSGYGGVGYRGLFRRSGRIFAQNYAFVRMGANGNAMVFGRSGAARFPLFPFYGPNSSHVMLHKPVSDPTIERFQVYSVQRFQSKMEMGLDTIKARYGL